MNYGSKEDEAETFLTSVYKLRSKLRLNLFLTDRDQMYGGISLIIGGKHPIC